MTILDILAIYSLPNLNTIFVKTSIFTKIMPPENEKPLE